MTSTFSFQAPFQHMTASEYAHLDRTYIFDRKLQAFLAGRRLRLEALKEFPSSLLDEHFHRGYLKVDPSFIQKQGTWVCRRCGQPVAKELSRYECGRCGEWCYYCRHCLTLGVLKQCSPLLSWCGPALPLKGRVIRPQWEGELTVLQQQTAEQLVRAVRKKESYLCWAVTGSGKTEILYPAITEAVREGLRIAIVAPRTDVIIELSKRLKRVFAEVSINILYGESPERFYPARMTLATTHQLLHFYDYFDCVFIDEVDAFPFHNNKMLHHALQQASKVEAPHFYLTATPSNKLKNAYRHGSLKGMMIPIRFHGYPLPMPSFQWIGDWKKQLNKQRLPNRLKTWIDQQLKSGRQAFLFVPSIEALERLYPLMCNMDHGIASVYADDSERHQKVEAFRQGEIRLLITTTILERGVTIPALDVAILGADDAIFDERALVQIAGRVGRAAEYPDGTIILFHHGITRQMQLANRHIFTMNRRAFDMNKKFT